MDKYSVLMSIYYKENPSFFQKALESIIKQSIPPDEIVLVEDGKLTDELYTIIEKYEKKYPELFNIVVNEQNLGLGLSLNKGVLSCKNNLIARMDTDDIALPERCEKQLLYFKNHPNTSILGGQIEEFIDSPKNIVGKRIVPTSDKELKDYLKKRCPFNHMTVMFKKSDVLKAGNYKDWFWNEDYYLWIRLAINKLIFANLSDTLVYTRVGEDMYRRRGGWKYFKSEAKLQGLMYKNGMINFGRYLVNVSVRFILQIIIPNKMRGYIFKMFARK